MIALYLACALLTLAVLALLALPWWKKAKGEGVSASRLNQHLYQLRSQELSEEDQQGLNDDQQALLNELQHNLLDEVADTESANGSQSTSFWPLLLGATFLVAGGLSLYVYLGGQSQLRQQQQALAQLPELSQKAMQGQAPMTEQELQDFALALRTKLQQEGDDAMGWWLLAQVGQAMNRFDLLMNASEKAYLLEPNSASITALYVQALLYSNQAGDKAKAERILVLALQAQAEQIELWSLYAFMALEAEQYQLAIERWQRMQALLEADTTRYQMLQQSIDYAQQQLAQQELPELKAAGEEGEYLIHIRLADSLPLMEEAFLFVYAKAVNGSPIPVAAKKIAHPRFPLTVTLSDQDSMMEGLLLSQQSEFFISARLSPDQNVATPEGDWQGQSEAISSDDPRPVQLVIDQAL